MYGCTKEIISGISTLLEGLFGGIGKDTNSIIEIFGHFAAAMMMLVVVIGGLGLLLPILIPLVILETFGFNICGD